MCGFLDRFEYIDDGRTSRADALFSFIREEIVRGRLAAGEKVPTIKELAAATGLTFRLARGVLERLAREKYVRSRPRVGSQVLPRSSDSLDGRVLFAFPDVDASSYHVMRMADALRRRMFHNGYAVTTVAFSREPGAPQLFLRRELADPPDIAIMIYSTASARKCIAERGVKCICVYGEDPGADAVAWLRFSAEEAISRFVGHCVRAGVKRVVEVRFDGNETPEARPALQAAGIDSTMMTVRRRDSLGRYEGIEREAFDAFMAMPKTEFPDVFLFWDDFVAQGALTAFLNRGVKMPDDVKLVALSNKGLGPVYPAPLTRMECDAYAAGVKLAEYALSVLSKRRAPAAPVISPQYVFGTTFPFRK